jgi:hypothetical protein
MTHIELVHGSLQYLLVSRLLLLITPEHICRRLRVALSRALSSHRSLRVTPHAFPLIMSPRYWRIVSITHFFEAIMPIKVTTIQSQLPSMLWLKLLLISASVLLGAQQSLADDPPCPYNAAIECCPEVRIVRSAFDPNHPCRCSWYIYAKMPASCAGFLVTARYGVFGGEPNQNGWVIGYAGENNWLDVGGFSIDWCGQINDWDFYIEFLDLATGEVVCCRKYSLVCGGNELGVISE